MSRERRRLATFCQQRGILAFWAGELLDFSRDIVYYCTIIGRENSSAWVGPNVHPPAFVLRFWAVAAQDIYFARRAF